MLKCSDLLSEMLFVLLIPNYGLKLSMISPFMVRNASSAEVRLSVTEWDSQAAIPEIKGFLIL
ncbi:hypothetical protein D3C71_2234590 [compost metagenome]